MNYDIFLVSAPKDQNKLRFVLEAIVVNMRGFENIYLCTPTWLDDEFISNLHFPINYRTDMQVLKAIPQKWKHRPSWVYQQFLKLFQNETKNDYFFVVDSDTIINKPLEVFEEDKPIGEYPGSRTTNLTIFFRRRCLDTAGYTTIRFLQIWDFIQRLWSGRC